MDSISIGRNDPMCGLKFSVVIITRNRAGFLPKILNSLLKQNCENDNCEFVVVDNNSNDDTPRVVERFEREWPNKIHYVFEPKVGMSRARNKGAEVAEGEILLFIDDDAIPEPHWLNDYCSIYEMFPDIVAAGGRIELAFQCEKPKWLSDELLVPLGYLNISDRETILSFPEHPFGGNFSVKRDTFIRVGGFIEELTNSNEEKAFFYKLHQNKFRVGYSPKALVYHQIPPSRLKRTFFIKRGLKQGMANVAFSSIVNPARISEFKTKFVQILFDGLIIIRNILFYPNRSSFTQVYYLCIRWGELFGIMMRRLKQNEYSSHSHTGEASQSSFRI